MFRGASRLFSARAAVCSTALVSSIGYNKTHAHPGHDDIKEHILFAIPKKGRLYEKIVQLLKGSGFQYHRPDRLDVASCTDQPISFVFLPASDIATYVGEGNVQIGITGEDIVAESDVDVEVLMKLGIGKCRLAVQAPQGAITDPSTLAGKRIATSFPHVTEKFFKQFEADSKPTHIREISGSVEAACGLGLADAIVDLVETGTTMRAAGLEEVATIMASQTVLIANPRHKDNPLVQKIVRRFTGYQTAQNHVMITYNLARANLDAACKITPGKKAPSILPLDTDGWVAVQALVKKKEAANIMDMLEAIGATDILVTELLSSRMD